MLKEIMEERIACIDIDDTEGAMNRPGDSMCLIKLIVRHNDPADNFHMDEHQVDRSATDSKMVSPS